MIVILKGIHWATLKKKKRQRKRGKMCKKIKRLDEEKAQMEEPGLNPGLLPSACQLSPELHPLLKAARDICKYFFLFEIGFITLVEKIHWV